MFHRGRKRVCTNSLPTKLETTLFKNIATNNSSKEEKGRPTAKERISLTHRVTKNTPLAQTSANSTLYAKHSNFPFARILRARSK